MSVRNQFVKKDEPRVSTTTKPPVPIGKTTSLRISEVRTDGGTQSRERIDPVVRTEYAEAISGGARFPAVVVYYDGEGYWLADGFHRVDAHKEAGKKKILAVILQGTRRDAILHGVGANAEHGLRRTNEDKRRAVLTLLRDAEWSKWSDREIARQCGVSHEFVRRLRLLTVNVDSEERTYTTKYGTTATMNTSAIGQANTAGPEADGADDFIASLPPDTAKQAAQSHEIAATTAPPEPTLEPQFTVDHLIELVDSIVAVPVDELVDGAGRRRAVLGQRMHDLIIFATEVRERLDQ